MHEPIWPESEGRGGEQEGGWRGNKSRRDSGVRGMGGVILIDGGEGFNNVRTPPPRGWGCNIYNFTRRHRCTPLPPSNAQPYLSSCPPIIHLLPSNIFDNYDSLVPSFFEVKSNFGEQDVGGGRSIEGRDSWYRYDCNKNNIIPRRGDESLFGRRDLVYQRMMQRKCSNTFFFRINVQQLES